MSTLITGGRIITAADDYVVDVFFEGEGLQDAAEPLQSWVRVGLRVVDAFGELELLDDGAHGVDDFVGCLNVVDFGRVADLVCEGEGFDPEAGWHCLFAVFVAAF